ncbi:MAG: SDR family oxidoreductase [Actinomycetota bacterium]
MKLLVLGGTVFLGRHVVERALDRGHDVTLFNRGRHGAELFPEVEKLRGNRDSELAPLRGRRWDAVVDTSGYVPRVVRAAAELLSPSIDRYIFVSSVSVYADTSAEGIDEAAPVESLHDPTMEDVDEHYGALKALCEAKLKETLPGRACSVRAGLLVGPHDPTHRFTYWVTRIAEGGRVLAPEPRDQPVQFIDARDLAAWMVDVAEHGRSGVFNVTGPLATMTMEELLQAIVRATNSRAELVWASDEFLIRGGVEPWSDLPLWLAARHQPAIAGFFSIDISRARAAGLTTRSVDDTVRDTLGWAASADPVDHDDPEPGGAGLTRDRERELITAWTKRSRP